MKPLTFLRAFVLGVALLGPDPRARAQATLTAVTSLDASGSMDRSIDISYDASPQRRYFLLRGLAPTDIRDRIATNHGTATAAEQVGWFQIPAVGRAEFFRILSQPLDSLSSAPAAEGTQSSTLLWPNQEANPGTVDPTAVEQTDAVALASVPGTTDDNGGIDDVTSSPLFEWSPADPALLVLLPPPVLYQFEIYSADGLDESSPDLLSLMFQRGPFHAATVPHVSERVPQYLYMGPPLVSAAPYYWRIRVVAGLSYEGPWTAFGIFRAADTALVSPEGLTPCFDFLSANPTPTLTDRRPTLRWNPVAGASTYRVEVYFAIPEEGEPDLTRPVPLPGAVTSATEFVWPADAPLEANHDYFWRVRAETGRRVGIWSLPCQFYVPPDGSGAELPLTAPAGLLPGAGTVTTPNPDFQWNPVPGATSYDFQIARGDGLSSGDADRGDLLPARVVRAFSRTVANPGHTPQVELGLAPTRTYYWRLRGRSATQAGPWCRWTRIRIGPAAPLLLSPRSGATLTRVPELVWQRFDGIQEYDFRVYADGRQIAGMGITYSGHAWSGTSANLTRVAPGLIPAGQAFQWEARARILPQDNPWPAQRASFDLAAPNASLRTPAHRSLDLPLPIRLAWPAVAGADGYDWQVLEGGRPISGFQVSYSGPYAGTSVSLDSSSLVSGRTYSWKWRGRVLPQNNPWSSEWTFRVAPPTSLPGRAPADNSAALRLPVRLDWPNVPGADGYDWQVLENSQPIAGFQRSYEGPYRATSVDLTQPTLQPGRAYTWIWRARVLPQDNDWSIPWKFTVDDYTPPESGRSPAANATELALPLRLTWPAVAGADGYDWQVLEGGKAVAGFQVSYDGPYRGNSVDLRNPPLVPGHRYVWKWRARVLPQDNVWSTEWAFTLKDPPLAAPVLTAPPNQTSPRIATTVTLDWAAVTGATGYRVYVVYLPSNGDPEQVVLDRTIQGGTTTSHRTTFQPGRNFRWRVLALRNAETSPWSSEWRFTTLTTN